MTKSIRVLLVDDDAGLRAELRLLLEDAGFQVVGEARDGVEGIAYARHERPDVVLSDLKMPGLSGLALAAELRDQIPVVLLSAYDDEGLQAQAREVGAGFLIKGCRSRAIFAAVQRAAGERAGG